MDVGEGDLMKSRTLVVASFAMAQFACNTGPAEGKSFATVSEPLAEAHAAAPSEAGVRYVFSSEASRLEFVGAKVTRTHEGGFGLFRGTVELVAGAPEKSRVTVDVDTASLTVDEAQLASHLKTDDFLDVTKFPKARFTSTSVRPGGDKGATHTISGNLELHGVTKGIRFPASVRVDGDAVDVDSEFAINRKDFGIVYPGMPDDLIKDDVLLKLTIRAKKMPE
jgi:polyisoprenoid-binding protein YceI